MRTYARAIGGVLVAAALSLGCGDSSGPVLQLVTNGGFETGDFTGWTVDNAGVGDFFVLSDSTGHGLADTILGPPESTYAAVTIQSGPGSHILYQDLALPTHSKIRLQATVYICSLASFADNGNLDHSGLANQQFRVDIVDPAANVRDVGAGVLLAVWRTMPGDPRESGYVLLDVDLTAFAGQTVRLRFAEVDNQVQLHAAVDAVSVTAR